MKSQELKYKYPNLFVVGVAKAATTSICSTLAKHDKVYCPAVKEPAFLALPPNGSESGLFHGVSKSRGRWEKFVPITSLKSYLSLYKDAPESDYYIDGSTQYFTVERAAETIREFNQNAKIIVQLREPFERAWSAYNYAKSKGDETKTFINALNEEVAGIRIKMSYGGYINGSAYGKHLNRFLSYFDKNQVFISYYEDFSANPDDVIRSIINFLGLEAGGVNLDVDRGNPTLITSDPVLRRVRHLGARFKNNWLAKTRLAQMIHKQILDRSERPSELPTNEERALYADHLSAYTNNFELERSLGINRYCR